MKHLTLMLSFCVIFSFSTYAQVVNFSSLEAAQGTNKSIEWTSSIWGNGFGHKIYNQDPGGKTLLNIAARQNSTTWVDMMTFTSNGKIGIGTKDPKAMLEVTDEFRVRLATNHEDKNVVRIIPLGYSGITGAMNWSIRGAYQYANGISYNSAGGDLDIIKSWDRNTILATKSDGTSLGKVGIGTTNPSQKLHVFDSGVVQSLVQSTDNHAYYAGQGASGKGSFVDFYREGDGRIWHTGLRNNNNNYEFRLHDQSPVLTLRENTTVGIGTTYPTYTLVVKNGPSATRGINLEGSNSRIYFEGKRALEGQSSSDRLDIGEGFATTQIVGNVGIGTANTGTWKLAVNGNIRAKEVKVQTGWSDFVFYDDYKLPSLKEVEKHIKEKGHLQDIPSAEEVAKNGVLLGAMDAKLLQKIEELTLYTIQQQKEIEQLKKESELINSLAEQLKSLKSELESLKKEETKE